MPDLGKRVIGFQPGEDEHVVPQRRRQFGRSLVRHGDRRAEDAVRLVDQRTHGLTFEHLRGKAAAVVNIACRRVESAMIEIGLSSRF